MCLALPILVFWGVASPPFFIMDELAKKTCNLCEEEKYFFDFSFNRESHDGLANTCKSCVKARNKDYARKNNPPSSKDYPYSFYD